MSPRTAALLCVAATLAGCLAPAPPPAAAACTDCTPPTLATPRVELFDCTGVDAMLEAGHDKVQNELPPGYNASMSEPTTNELAVRAFECASAVLDGRAVLGRLRFAWVQAFIDKTADSLPGLADAYVLEMFSDNATLAWRFSQAGFPTQVATVTLDAGQPASAAVALGADPVFSLRSAGTPSLGNATNPYSERLHHAAAERHRVDLTATPAIRSDAQAGVLTARQGTLARILAPTGTSPFRGLLEGSATLRFDFTG